MTEEEIAVANMGTVERAYRAGIAAERARLLPVLRELVLACNLDLISTPDNDERYINAISAARAAVGEV